MRPAATALGAVVLMLAAACHGGSAEEVPTPPIGQTATPTLATATATASSTPDPLLSSPTSQVEARAWLQNVLGPSYFDPPCPERLKTAGVACASGDATGDGAAELAYLVPVKMTDTGRGSPAAVFVRGGSSQKLDEFALDLTADSSVPGRALFQFADRTGDGRPDLSYVQNICGATGCSSRAVVLTWDGTAWRDAGPGDSVANVDRIAWSGEGSSSILAVHGGKLPASAPAESGPTRASTTSYGFAGGRYTARSVESDPPEYLYHLVEDADDAFQTDRAGSQATYREVIDSTTLKDWKLKPDDPDRRPALVGYALFRLALIDAAMGRDPTAALDRVIRDSKEPLFVYLAEAFRNGFQVRGGVVGGCAEANLYLRTPQGAGPDPGGYVAQLFNYGYANPPGSKWIAKMCPF